MAKVVFDANSQGNFTISELQFVRGVYVTEDEAEIDMLRKYIKATKADVVDGWFEQEYDAANPRHNQALKPAPLAKPVTGTMTVAQLFATTTASQVLPTVTETSFDDVASTTGLAAALANSSKKG